MSNRILYSQASNTGKMTAQAVNHLLDSLAEMRRLKGIMDQATASSDFTALAAELGLPTDTAGQALAQATWTIISNATNAIDVAAVTELSRLDQG